MFSNIFYATKSTEDPNKIERHLVRGENPIFFQYTLSVQALINVRTYVTFPILRTPETVNNISA